MVHERHGHRRNDARSREVRRHLLGSGDRINRAADSIAAAVQQGHEVAVVASAMGNTTDELLEEINYDADSADRADIGPWANDICRMLKGALAARGIEAVFREPGTDEWPVITNDLGEVDVEATRERAAKLAAELDGVVPVITGFLAQNHDGEITTLGRGGSDTSAVMLGNYMDADEVVIVTDVEGVMTGDPRVVEGARNVGRITVDELRYALVPRGRGRRAVGAVVQDEASVFASSTTSTATCSPAGRSSKASSTTSSTCRKSPSRVSPSPGGRFATDRASSRTSRPPSERRTSTSRPTPRGWTR